MYAAFISSINQHCFEGERRVLIKYSKSTASVQRLLAEIVVAVSQTCTTSTHVAENLQQPLR